MVFFSFNSNRNNVEFRKLIAFNKRVVLIKKINLSLTYLPWVTCLKQALITTILQNNLEIHKLWWVPSKVLSIRNQ